MTSKRVRTKLPRLHPVGLALCAAVAMMSAPAFGASSAKTMKLDNGMQVVAIEDHRAPVVTHIIAYRVGAADDPERASGAAHYLEHMMFKSAGALKSGEYAARVARHGGSTNAVTSHDTTIYHARVPRGGLRWLMQLEAQRMTGLDILQSEFEAERSVIQSERRSRIEAAPLNALIEEAASLLHVSHPYRRPAIGWAHEIAKIDRQHLVDLYRRTYAPANAVAVVAGDVTAAEVFAIARETYGKVSVKGAAHTLPRSEDPPPRAARRLSLADPRVAAPLLYRVYAVPSYLSGDRRDALSLDILATILAHRALGRLAVSPPEDLASVDGGYSGQKRESGQLALVLAGTRNADPANLEKHLDDVIATLCASGISADEKDIAESVLAARRSFDLDDQLELTRTYAQTLALGGRITDIESFEAALHAVTVADVQNACKKYLVPERSATGLLLPLESKPTDSTTAETAESRQ